MAQQQKTCCMQKKKLLFYFKTKRNNEEIFKNKCLNQDFRYNLIEESLQQQYTQGKLKYATIHEIIFNRKPKTLDVYADDSKVLNR